MHVRSTRYDDVMSANRASDMIVVNEGVSRIRVLHFVDLDIIYDRYLESPHDAALSLTDGLSAVEATVLRHFGPDGWPVVRFSGPVDQLEALIDRYERSSHSRSDRSDDQS